MSVLAVRRAVVATALLTVVVAGCTGGQGGGSSPSAGKVVVERNSAGSKEAGDRAKTAGPKVGSGLGEEFRGGDEKGVAPLEAGGGTDGEKSGEDKG